MTQMRLKTMNLIAYGVNVLVYIIFFIIGMIIPRLLDSSTLYTYSIVSRIISIVIFLFIPAVLVGNIIFVSKKDNEVTGVMSLLIAALVLIILDITLSAVSSLLVPVIINNNMGIDIGKALMIFSYGNMIVSGLLFWGSFTCMLLGLRNQVKQEIVLEPMQ